MHVATTDVGRPTHSRATPASPRQRNFPTTANRTTLRDLCATSRSDVVSKVVASLGRCELRSPIVCLQSITFLFTEHQWSPISSPDVRPASMAHWFMSNHFPLPITLDHQIQIPFSTRPLLTILLQTTSRRSRLSHLLAAPTASIAPASTTIC
jgi:hypothetical protein